MEKLDKSEITVEQAKAQAQIGKQVNNILKYELDRTKLLMELSTFNKENNKSVELREIESKAFDNNIVS